MAKRLWGVNQIRERSDLSPKETQRSPTRNTNKNGDGINRLVKQRKQRTIEKCSFFNEKLDAWDQNRNVKKKTGSETKTDNEPPIGLDFESIDEIDRRWRAPTPTTPGRRLRAGRPLVDVRRRRRYRRGFPFYFKVSLSAPRCCNDFLQIFVVSFSFHWNIYRMNSYQVQRKRKVFGVPFNTKISGNSSRVSRVL